MRVDHADRMARVDPEDEAPDYTEVPEGRMEPEYEDPFNDDLPTYPEPGTVAGSALIAAEARKLRGDE